MLKYLFYNLPVNKSIPDRSPPTDQLRPDGGYEPVCCCSLLFLSHVTAPMVLYEELYIFEGGFWPWALANSSNSTLHTQQAYKPAS